MSCNGIATRIPPGGRGRMEAARILKRDKTPTTDQLAIARSHAYNAAMNDLMLDCDYETPCPFDAVQKSVLAGTWCETYAQTKRDAVK